MPNDSYYDPPDMDDGPEGVTVCIQVDRTDFLGFGQVSLMVEVESGDNEGVIVEGESWVNDDVVDLDVNMLTKKERIVKLTPKELESVMEQACEIDRDNRQAAMEDHADRMREFDD
jgi:hypothetical protein